MYVFVNLNFCETSLTLKQTMFSLETTFHTLYLCCTIFRCIQVYVFQIFFFMYPLFLPPSFITCWCTLHRNIRSYNLTSFIYRMISLGLSEGSLDIAGLPSHPVSDFWQISSCSRRWGSSCPMVSSPTHDCTTLGISWARVMIFTHDLSMLEKRFASWGRFVC